MSCALYRKPQKLRFASGVNARRHHHMIFQLRSGNSVTSVPKQTRRAISGDQSDKWRLSDRANPERKHKHREATENRAEETFFALTDRRSLKLRISPACTMSRKSFSSCFKRPSLKITLLRKAISSTITVGFGGVITSPPVDFLYAGFSMIVKSFSVRVTVLFRAARTLLALF